VTSFVFFGRRLLPPLLLLSLLALARAFGPGFLVPFLLFPLPLPGGLPAPRLPLVRFGPAARVGARGLSPSTAVLFDRQDGLPQAHGVAPAHVHLADGAGDAGGQLEGRLVGLELEDGLVLLEGVAFRDQDVEDLRLLDVLAEVRQLELVHVSLTR
jgi:hypothetical protein